MTEYLDHYTGRLVMDGLNLQALDLIRDLERANYQRGEAIRLAAERVAHSCQSAALAVGVNPAQVREYDFPAQVELYLEI